MYWKGEAVLLEDRAYDYGCNSGTPLRDAVGSFFKKKELHPRMEQYITWTGTTQCPTLQTHTPHQRPSIQGAGGIGQFIYIPWLVDSYDMHKGKRWLNSNPQTTGGILWGVDFSLSAPKCQFIFYNPFSLCSTKNLHEQKHFLKIWYTCFVYIIFL